MQGGVGWAEEENREEEERGGVEREWIRLLRIWVGFDGDWKKASFCEWFYVLGLK